MIEPILVWLGVTLGVVVAWWGWRAIRLHHWQQAARDVCELFPPEPPPGEIWAPNITPPRRYVHTPRVPYPPPEIVRACAEPPLAWPDVDWPEDTQPGVRRDLQ